MLPALLTRLRWSSEEAASPRARAAVLARSFAYLYGAGATLVALTLLLPAPDARRPWLLVVAVALAYGVVAVMLGRFDRLPLRLFPWLPVAGAVLVSLVVLGGGAHLVAAYATIYFWVVLSAHYFFGARAAAATTAFTAALYGGVLVITPGVSEPATKWVTLAATLAVAGLLVTLLREHAGRLVGRLERHAEQSDALARFSRIAFDRERAEGLARDAVALLRDVYGAECATVLLAEAGEPATVRVAAAGGWARDPTGIGGVPAGARTLIGRALASGEPVFGDDHPELARSTSVAGEGVRSSLLVPLLGRDAVHGAVALDARTPRAFGPADAAQLEAITSVLAGALDRAAAAERLRHQAYHDDLTGLPNRNQLAERLDGALARAAGRGVAVLFVDLDNFKVLNDSLGHDVGDAVLRAVVPRLRQALLSSDTLARFGGDAFVILCEGVDGEAAALAVAERVHAALRDPFRLAGGAHRVTASVGVAIARRPTDTADALVRDADAALSRAKALGRDRTAIYDEGMRREALGRLRLENALRDAVGSGQLRLVHQPIVDLRDGRIVACESLLRWTHPELGEIRPAQMIPLAEETGTIVAIGDWVVEEACRTAQRWRAIAGRRAPLVSVNVSARQLVTPALTDHVAKVLERTATAPSDLVLEITESATIEDSSPAVARLTELRALGVRLAIDDFGTGYSSLAHLRRFAVGTVKIDRSFVAGLHEPGGEAMVSAILGLTSGLDARAVAEGIETPEQLEALRALGCRYGQGFLLARPMSAPAIEVLLRGGGIALPVG